MLLSQDVSKQNDAYTAKDSITDCNYCNYCNYKYKCEYKYKVQVQVQVQVQQVRVQLQVQVQIQMQVQAQVQTARGVLRKLVPKKLAELTKMDYARTRST